MMIAKRWSTLKNIILHPGAWDSIDHAITSSTTSSNDSYPFAVFALIRFKDLYRDRGVTVNANAGYSLWPDACVSGDQLIKHLGACTFVKGYMDSRSEFVFQGGMRHCNGV